jgi:choline dehydrogenase-like flavoprotein
LTKGFAELGLEALNSFGSGKLLGWSFIPQTLDQETQMRSSSAEMLYSAISQGNRVSLYKSSLAKKINFDGKRATGVAVETAGTQYLLTASKEVIVSAGVVCKCESFVIHSLTQYVDALATNANGLWHWTKIDPTAPQH